MPLYEYECKDCGENYEELVRTLNADSPPCPQCHSTKTEKKMSVFGGRSSTSSCGTSGFT
jgi:putative FmdB family regulatory protein